MGRKADAIRYAEASRGLNDSPVAIARRCEEILLSSGAHVEEAYARYAIEANPEHHVSRDLSVDLQEVPDEGTGAGSQRPGGEHAGPGG